MSLFCVSQICVRFEEWSEPPLTSSDLKFAQKREREEEEGRNVVLKMKKHKIWAENKPKTLFLHLLRLKERNKKEVPGCFSFSGNAHAQ